MRAFTSTPVRTLTDEVLSRFAREVLAVRRGEVNRVVVLTVASTLTPFAGAVALRGVVDRLEPGRWSSAVAPWALALAAAGALHVLVGVARVRRAQALAAAVVGDLQVRLFERFLRMPMTFFARARPGAVATRVVNDLDALEQAVGNSLPAAVGGVVTVVAALVAFVVVDWRLVAVASLVVVMVPAMRGRLRTVRRHTERVLSINGRTYDAAFERLNFAGAQHVKLFGDPDTERRSFAELAEERQRIRATMRSAVLTLDPIANGVLSVVTAVGVVVAMALTRLDVGSVVFFAVAMRLAQQPIAGAAAIQVDLAVAAVVLDRVYESLDFVGPGEVERAADAGVDQVDEGLDAASGPAASGARLELRSVSFTFPSTKDVVPPSLAIGLGSEGAETVLDDVSLEVGAGEFVGIVGPTGSGKSSLAGLLVGLLAPSSGQVLLDDSVLGAVAIEKLRREVAFVTQEGHLFNDTILRNLTYGRPDATHGDVVAACQAARIHGFVHSLASGYNTVVGERGARLSGGQRQRLALARAIVVRPRVLVLDEATAHVDVETEAAILAALDDHLDGVTRVVVAHRLNVVRRADRIVVLDRGRIVEVGSHDALMEREGPYRRAWEVQVGG